MTSPVETGSDLLPDPEARPDELRFDGQVAIVTGGAGTIGRAYVEALVARGASVVVNDLAVRDDAKAQSPAHAYVADLADRGYAVVLDSHDVRSASAEVVQTALDQFGRLDVLVNNAGTWSESSLDPFDPAFKGVFDSHLFGTLAMTAATWEELSSRRGRIVQTSSAGIFGGSSSYAYPIAKSAIFGSVIALRERAEADGILINAVLPVAHSLMMEESLPDGERKDRLRQFTAADVAEFVMVLAHSTCPFQGMAFDVGGRHAARVVYAQNAGLTLDRAAEFRAAAGSLSLTEGLQYCPSAELVMRAKLDRLASSG